ncbi:surfeit locus protein 1-like isoform X2 [Eutrema salsugineum]|uniref:surfeit locus protein 1-like isoform X2 n=1 Tax=Eutrema salsugineum TaxID=72664 RepID=UPI000CED532F|nr:surfeit locus protein 1-like isoform X2 [Eutrema salsugineum]
MMQKLFAKTLTKLISHSHRSSTRSNLSAAPLLHPAPKTSTSLETRSMSSAIPPAKKKIGSTLLWFLGGLFTYGVADWQKIRQREEIMKQLDFRQLCLQMEPMKLMTAVKNVDRIGFRRVVCKGVFDKQRSIYVGPKPRSMSKGSESGFYVITPLLPIPNEPNSMKSPILVNRGWVPSDWKEESLESTKTDDVAAKELRKANKLLPSQQNPLLKFLHKLFAKSVIAEEQASRVMHVEVVGVVRKSEIPGIFVLPNDPSSGKWFFVDVPELAQAMGFGENTIYIEKTYSDIDENRPYPVPRDNENLIRSKGVPMDNYLYSFLW